ncbi:hypothetical protein [Streptomyces sp. NPDC088348]|uniref:hypothetical protein n=1 Tax=Streptomyces sp. NPDC088348 TaxID=3365853 RepID=UPI003821D9B9
MEAVHGVPEQQEQQQQEQQQQEQQQQEQSEREQQQEPGRPSRRRGRTTLIVASAALLGIVGGGAIGYTIQADRPPTRLPALAQRGPAYPAKPLAEGAGRGPLTAAEDRRVTTDGDLRKQLVPRPPGARTADRPVYARGGLPRNGWLTPGEYGMELVRDADGFTDLIQSNVRRIAADDWMQGQDREAAVRLVQFRAGSGLAAQETADEQLRYLPDTDADEGERGGTVKGSGNARYVVRAPESTEMSGDGYWATAMGWRGDVMFEINVFDSRPISQKDIRTLAERQLERL